MPSNTDPTTAELTRYVQDGLASLQSEPVPGYEHPNLLSFVLAEGHPFTDRAPVPDSLRGPMGHCYSNAQAAVLADPGLTYCEGYAALEHGGLIEHAWTETADGRVLDVTWDDEPAGYIGVRFNAMWVRRTLSRCWSASIIFGDFTRSKELMRDGLPLGARAQRRLRFAIAPARRWSETVAQDASPLLTASTSDCPAGARRDGPIASGSAGRPKEHR